MKYQEAPPSPRLARFVKCFWSLVYDGPVTEGPEPVVPDGSIEIIFNLADRFRRIHNDGSVEIQPANIVTGQMRSHVTIEPGGNVHLFAVRFHPAGAYPFFDFGLRELTDRIEDLDAVWGGVSRSIADRLIEEDSFDRRVGVMEDILVRRLSSAALDGRSISTVAAAIVNDHGVFPVAAIARAFGVSERNLERQFNDRIGLSPKTFSRIVRFQRVLKMLKTESPNRVETALAHGYFDQSHMINDFRQFAGVNPTSFLQSSHQLTELFTNTG